MPYHFSFEPAVGRVRLQVSGTLDDALLAKAFRAIYTHPDYTPGLHELTDCRAVSHFHMTVAGLRALMNVVEELQRADAPYRVAIVAPRDAVFGMARMYEMMCAEGLEEVHVCRTLEEAEALTEGAA